MSIRDPSTYTGPPWEPEVVTARGQNQLCCQHFPEVWTWYSNLQLTLRACTALIYKTGWLLFVAMGYPVEIEPQGKLSSPKQDGFSKQDAPPAPRCK